MNEDDMNFVIQNYEKNTIYITAIRNPTQAGHTKLEIGKSYEVIGYFELGNMFKIDMIDKLMYFEYYCFSVDRNQIRKKKLESL